MIRNHDGFTAVELLVALVVGVLLLGSAYQLYTVILRDSGDAQRRSHASDIAYDLLRQAQSNSSIASNPCSAKANVTITMPTYAKLPGSSAKADVICPDNSNLELSLITITVTYRDSSRDQQVYRAITTRSL